MLKLKSWLKIFNVDVWDPDSRSWPLPFQEEIVADLEKVCSMMPATIKDDCKDFVDTYGPAVVEMLVQELDPKEVCTILGLCASSKRAAVKTPTVVKGDEMCGVCETVIQYLDSILQENATEEEIKKDLERICNFLPDTLKEQVSGCWGEDEGMSHCCHCWGYCPTHSHSYL